MNAAQAVARPQAPAGVLNTLLAFEQAPGRYAVALREPRQLFDHLQAVMLLAAGRELPELAEALKQQPQARRAARFFVRTVMLRPGADHYALLGLTPGFEPGTLREHYRLMIRMTHPDFAGEDGEWPTDAATRINLANDVLSSSVRRAEYNALQAGAGQAAGVGGAAHAARHAPKKAAARPLPAAAVRPPRRKKPEGRWPEAWTPRLKVALAALGALGTGWALLAMNPSGSDSSLVVQVAKKQAPTNAVKEPPVLAVLEAPAVATAATAVAEAVEATPVQVADMAQVAPVAQVAEAPRTWRKVRREAAALEPVADVPVSAVPAPVVQEAAAPTTVAAMPARVEAPAAVAPAGLGLAATKVLKSSPAPAPVPTPVPTLEQVQPMLAKIVHLAKGGLGKPVAYLIHPSTRFTPSAQAFVFAFQDELAGTKVMDVLRTEVKSRESPEGLVVDMKMTFQVEDTSGWAATRQMSVRAHFAQIEKSPALTRLAVNP